MKIANTKMIATAEMIARTAKAAEMSVGHGVAPSWWMHYHYDCRLPDRSNTRVGRRGVWCVVKTERSLGILSRRGTSERRDEVSLLCKTLSSKIKKQI
jgi:hypothetical protein